MSQINGVVKRILTTPWQDKLLHGFVLENDDRMFGTGIIRVPGVDPGVSITFTPTKNPKNGRWQVDTKNVIINQQVRGPVAPAQVFEDKAAKEEYWAVKERVAEFSYARRDAMELADLLLRNDAIKMPAKKDKYEVIVELVNHLTKELVEQNETVRNPVEAEEAAEVSSEQATIAAMEDEEWK